jgi:hypothetical protein
VIVDCAVYEEGRRREGRLPLEDAHEAAQGDGAFVWIGLFEPSVEEFEAVRREFDLHELAVEDAIEATQRPKLEVYGDMLFVVLKTTRWNAEQNTIEFGEILAFVGDEFLITVRHGETGLHDVRLRLEKRPDLLGQGPAAALYADEATACPLLRRVPVEARVGRPKTDLAAAAVRDPVAQADHPGLSRHAGNTNRVPGIDQAPRSPSVVACVDTVLAARPAVQPVGEAAVLGQRAFVRPDDS